MPTKPGTKTTLTPEEIARVAYSAGFKNRTTLSRAVAVALAESGGQIRATNKSGNTPPSTDRGLWQINDHWHKEVSDAEAFNPPAAAAHVHRISKGGTVWREWSTWNNGAAGAQMGRAALAAAKVVQNPDSVTIDAQWWDPLDLVPEGDGSGGDGLGNLGDALMFPVELVKYAGQLTELTIKASGWLMNPANWLRVLEVVAGAGVVILGVKMLADSGVGGPVGAAARGAVKTAKAGAKQVKKVKQRAETVASVHPAGAAAVAAKNSGKTTAASSAKKESTS
ncbi:transglycosylase SLT domain-containing protein [Streptomyces californicus]|uniref:transglycosylase SLT domain-containing protein n=1 Tax=Streptomyces californicus TaxID=67351 RepID=UPI003677911D